MATGARGAPVAWAILRAMPPIGDPQPVPSQPKPRGNGAWRTVQIVLGAAMVVLGVGLIGSSLIEMLFYTPAMLYNGLFFGGERAASASAPVHRAFLEGASALVATAYGAVLSLCGTMNWRVLKPSLWFVGVVAMLAAYAAFAWWRSVPGVDV